MKFWILLILSVITGLLLGLMDTSPGWDDTGISVGAILLRTCIFGFILPGRAWLWAIIIGLGVVGLNILQTGHYDSALVFLFAFAGAYAGVFFKWLYKQNES